MNPEFEKCLERGSLAATEPHPTIITGELEAAGYDIEKAETSLGQGDAKWATVQAYYAMFHAAKALVRAKGYKERSHYCLLIALRNLYASELDNTFLSAFENAMDLREEADYELKYSKTEAETVLRHAQEFLNEAKRLLSQKS